ncbi:MAG: site-specific integrase [Acidimicrobiia bacterium]
MADSLRTWLIPEEAFGAPDVLGLTPPQRAALEALLDVALEAAMSGLVRELSNSLARDARLVECLELWAALELARDGEAPGVHLGGPPPADVTPELETPAAVGGGAGGANRAVEAFLSTYRNPNTHRSYRSELLAFGRWCFTARLDPLEVRREDLERYLRDGEQAGRAASSLARRASVLSSFFAFCEEEGYLELRRCGGCGTPAGPRPPPR